VEGEKSAATLLRTFTCCRNSDLESFLREKAINHEKSHKSRTYLLVDGYGHSDSSVVAFISLAIHTMDIRNVSSATLKKRLHGLYYPPANNDCKPVPCYLIGQVAKDDSHTSRINGDELISMAIGLINFSQSRVGGRFIKLDCQDEPRLLELYERHGFRRVQRAEESGLVEMVRFF
jgi:predicted GNAT family N-acyltransferase